MQEKLEWNQTWTEHQKSILTNLVGNDDLIYLSVTIG